MDGQIAEKRTAMRVPAHGRGRLMAPWQKGQAPNPGGRGGEYREVQRLAREASPKAIAKLIELMASDDERVASVAANSVLDRAFGKVRERAPEDDRPRTIVDLSRLTTEQRDLLRALFNSGAIRPVDEAAMATADMEGEAREV